MSLKFFLVKTSLKKPAFFGTTSLKRTLPTVVSIIDPLSVPDADFIFKVNDVQDNDGLITNAKWSLTKIEDGDSMTIQSANSMIDQAQQVLPEWGLGITFKGVPSLESGQVDNLGCLSCPQGTPVVSNPFLDNLFWDLNLSSAEMADVMQSSEWSDAMENLWIQPVPDIDDVWQFVPFLRPFDWVRSGQNSFSQNDEVLAPFHNFGDMSVNGTQLDPGGTSDQQNPLDPNGVHENQWLVPYKLVSSDYEGRPSESTTGNVVNSIDPIGGGLAWHDWKTECSLDNLNNVDVVLTDDKSLWTRCPVLDMSEDTLEWVGPGTTPVYQSNGPQWAFGVGPGSSSYPWEIIGSQGENGENKWDLRLDMNVDKDGNPDQTGSGFNSENGWGWFPGYAIDVSTGRRLNIMFSENSSLGSDHNADDMLFNPVPNNEFDVSGLGPQSFGDDVPQNISPNGGHVVFILDTEYAGDNQEDNPHYDAYTGSSANNAWNSLRKKQVIPHIQWVGNWYPNSDQEWLSNEVIIRARVQEGYGFREFSVLENIDSDSLVNNGYPYYEFNSSEL